MASRTITAAAAAFVKQTPDIETLPADLVFTAGQQFAGVQRVDGQLAYKNLNFKANSGTAKQNLPLPSGRYMCYGLLKRTGSSKNEQAMQPKGTKNKPVATNGWSVVIEPLFASGRRNLRIHPDGGMVMGTQGCIGIVGLDDCKRCYNILRWLFSTKKILILDVQHGNNKANKS